MAAMPGDATRRPNQNGAKTGGPGGEGGPPRHLLAPSRQRPAPNAGALARRRLLVQAAKRVLPAFAVLLLVLIAIWPELDSSEERNRVAFRRGAQPPAQTASVVDPRYQGLDDLGRPYTVTAATAEQNSANDHLVNLHSPRADILMNGGSWVLLEAQNGVYDRDKSVLQLHGDVTVYHDNGTMLHTEAATIQLGAGSAGGDQPVAAQGPFGTLTGQGFELSDKGSRIIFTGLAHALLEGSSE